MVLDGGGFAAWLHGGTRSHHAGAVCGTGRGNPAAKRNIERWRDMGPPVIAAFCASCKHSLDICRKGGMEQKNRAVETTAGRVRAGTALSSSPDSNFSYCL